MKKVRIIAVMLMAALLMSMAGTLALAADDMTLKTTASVNLRKGPGLDYEKIVAVSEGRSYDYTGISKYDSRGVVWHRVEYKNGYAWVSSRYSDVYSDWFKLDDDVFILVKGSLNLRRGPGTGYGKITTVCYGEKLFYLGESAKDGSGNTWYKISSAYGEAWIISKYVEKKSYTPVYDPYVLTTASVNLRKGPGIGYGRVIAYAKDKKLDYLGETMKDGRGVKWYKVTDGRNTGWISDVYSDLYK